MAKNGHHAFGLIANVKQGLPRLPDLVEALGVAMVV